MQTLITSPGTMLFFINSLRETDTYIADIYLNGGCYQFHLLLKKLAPRCKPYINKGKSHVITKYQGKYYDITGEVSPNGFTKMTSDEINRALKWSFAKHMALQISECPACEEPIIV